MANLWNDKAFPKKGWECSETVDLDFPIAEGIRETCQMCGKEGLRHVHYLTHPEHDGTLGTGCCCAEKLEQVKWAPRQRQSKAANYTRRHKNWQKRKWRTSQKGNPYLNIDGYRLGVYEILQEPVDENF